jgi:ribose transport system substrate-binding protein
MRSILEPRNRKLCKIASGVAGAVFASLIMASGLSPANGATLTAAQRLANAQRLVTTDQREPVSLPVTKPISKPIPRGKTIDYITCGQSSGCTQSAVIAGQAAALLHWTVNTISTDGSPEGYHAAFGVALRQKPYAIIYQAASRSDFASYLPQIKADHIFLAGLSTNDTVGNGVDFVFGGPVQYGEPVSKAQAAAVAVSSKGTAHSVFVNIPSFAFLVPMTNFYGTALKSYCPKCTASTLNLALTAVGTTQATTDVVTYLQAHRDVKYLVFVADTFTPGLPEAMSAAGVGDVQVIGQSAVPENIQWLDAGQELYDVAAPYYEQTYAEIDAVARHAAGVPLLQAGQEPYPVWLLTKANAPTLSPDQPFFAVVKNFESKYKKLWGLEK